MMLRTSLLAVLLAVCGLATTLPARADPEANAPLAPDRTVLVMLRLPPPHFRPDVAYGGNYDVRAGRTMRARIAESLAREHRLQLVNEWPMPALGVDCFVMQAEAGASVGAIVDALARDARVESVQAMHSFSTLAYNDPLYPLQPAAMQWHLDELHARATGKGVRIAEVDTGVEVDHPDLAGQRIVARNFVDATDGPAEVHGTAVAGIMLARPDNAQGIAGIAPDARLLALRACWSPNAATSSATCNSFTLAKALQFALDERAQVINLSLGGPRDRLLERLIDVALARGVAVVAAVDRAVRDGGFPASYPGVLAIDGSEGQHPALGLLAAPSRDIPTTLPNRRWGFVSGSSFAAAHVTALIALLLELDPNLQATQLRTALASRKDEEAVPVVDACAAVSQAARSCACHCAVARAASD